MIRIDKEYEGKYYAFNDNTGASADIIRVYEHNPLGKDKVRYRVDYQGLRGDISGPRTGSRSEF